MKNRSIHQHTPEDRAPDVPGCDPLRQTLLTSLILGCLVYLVEALTFSLWIQGKNYAGAVLFLTFSTGALWCFRLGVFLCFKRKWCEWQGRSTPPPQPPVIKRPPWYEWTGLWFLLVGLVIGEVITRSLMLTVLAASFSWILIESGLRPSDEVPARATHLARELRFPALALTHGLPWIVALLCLRIASQHADPWLASIPISSPGRLMLALGVRCAVLYGVSRIKRPPPASDPPVPGAPACQPPDVPLLDKVARRRGGSVSVAGDILPIWSSLAPC